MHSVPGLTWDEALLRLALAAVLGGAIGVEREIRVGVESFDVAEGEGKRQVQLVIDLPRGASPGPSCAASPPSPR